MFCQDQVSVALYVLCWIFYDSISIRDTCADVGRDERTLQIPPTIDALHGYIYIYCTPGHNLWA